MDGGDVCDVGVLRQRVVERRRIVGNVFGSAEDRMIDSRLLQHQTHSLAVSAVGQDRDLALRWKARLEDRFDPEGPAALHQDRLPAVLSPQTGEPQKAFPDGTDLRIKLPMPRTGVVKHRLLHGQGGGERAGGKEQLIPGSGELGAGIHGQTAARIPRLGGCQRQYPEPGKVGQSSRLPRGLT
jgi:hypothetical protein